MPSHPFHEEQREEPREEYREEPREEYREKTTETFFIFFASPPLQFESTRFIYPLSQLIHTRKHRHDHGKQCKHLFL